MSLEEKHAQEKDKKWYPDIRDWRGFNCIDKANFFYDVSAKMLETANDSVESIERKALALLGFHLAVISGIFGFLISNHSILNSLSVNFKYFELSMLFSLISLSVSYSVIAIVTTFVAVGAKPTFSIGSEPKNLLVESNCEASAAFTKLSEVLYTQEKIDKMRRVNKRSATSFKRLLIATVALPWVSILLGFVF